MLAVDYGPQREPEIYQVATNSDPASPGVTAAKMLGDILRMPYVADRQNGLTAVRDVAVNASDGPRWTVQHLHNGGTGFRELADYDAPDGGYGFDDILVRPGDVLHLAFGEPGEVISWGGGTGVMPTVQERVGSGGLGNISSADGGVPRGNPQLPELPEGGPVPNPNGTPDGGLPFPTNNAGPPLPTGR